MSELVLGPAVQSVDVTCVVDGGRLMVKGCPMNLTFVHIKASCISMERCLHEHLQAKQIKPLVCAKHKVVISGANVIYEQASSAKLILFFGSRHP